MNKTLLALLVTCSVSVSAAPYVGLEYGLGTTDHDLEPHFSADNVTLNPELEDGIFSGFVGYAFNDNWALELGYSQFDLDDSHSKNLGIKPVDGKDTIMKWIGMRQSKPNKCRWLQCLATH